MAFGTLPKTSTCVMLFCAGVAIGFGLQSGKVLGQAVAVCAVGQMAVWFLPGTWDRLEIGWLKPTWRFLLTVPLLVNLGCLAAAAEFMQENGYLLLFVMFHSTGCAGFALLIYMYRKVGSRFTLTDLMLAAFYAGAMLNLLVTAWRLQLLHP